MKYFYPLMSVVLLLACFDVFGMEGYIVSSDKKIYQLDLESGRVTANSPSIPRLGRPTSIALNHKTNLLYIGSERGHGQVSYDPIIAVNIKTMPFKVAKRFHTEPMFDIKNDPRKITPIINAVYWLMVSPDGKSLHVRDAGFVDKPLVTLVDINTGKPQKWQSLAIGANDLLSPDRRKIISMWPAGKRSGNTGTEKSARQWKAGMAIGDMEKGVWGQRQSLFNGKFQPPWGRVESPFIYIRPGTNSLTVYNRDTTQVVSSFDLYELTNLVPAQQHVLPLRFPNRFALSMVDSNRQGFVVIIDYLKKQSVLSIPVGPNPTNLVLTANTQ